MFLSTMEIILLLLLKNQVIMVIIKHSNIPPLLTQIISLPIQVFFLLHPFNFTNSIAIPQKQNSHHSSSIILVFKICFPENTHPHSPPLSRLLKWSHEFFAFPTISTYNNRSFSKHQSRFPLVIGEIVKNSIASRPR